MEICTSEADSTAEKTKDSNHGQHVNGGGQWIRINWVISKSMTRWSTCPAAEESSKILG